MIQVGWPGELSLATLDLVDEDGDLTVPGSVFVEQGSVGSPSHSFTDDTASGMFSPAADAVVLAAGGVEAIRYTNDAGKIVADLSGRLSMDNQLAVGTFLNVGSPSTPASVTGEASFGAQVIVDGNVTILLAPTAPTAAGASHTVNPASATAGAYLLYLGVGGVDSMTVDEAGNVVVAGALGIGRATATDPLHVAGSGAYDGTVIASFDADGSDVVASELKENGIQAWNLRAGTSTVVAIIQYALSGTPSILMSDPSGNFRADITHQGFGGFGGLKFRADSDSSPQNMATFRPGVFLFETGAAAGACSIDCSGIAGSDRAYRYWTGVALRWIVKANATAESGSNAGSDYVIQARNDGSGNLGDRFTIIRSTGEVQISQFLNVGTPSTRANAAGEAAFAGDLYAGAALEIDGDLNHDGTKAGFYATAPIVKQTGVAVTAAAVHAALVNLGLIAA